MNYLNGDLSDQEDFIQIIDWAGTVLFEGHYEDDQVDEILEANRCYCDNDQDGGCRICNDTGYSGDFEVNWLDEDDTRNVYEFINY